MTKKLKGPAINSYAHKFLKELAEVEKLDIKKCLQRRNVNELRQLLSYGFVEVDIKLTDNATKFLEQIEGDSGHLETLKTFMTDDAQWSEAIYSPRKITKIDDNKYNVMITHDLNDNCSVKLKFDYSFGSNINDENKTNIYMRCNRNGTGSRIDTIPKTTSSIRRGTEIYLAVLALMYKEDRYDWAKSYISVYDSTFLDRISQFYSNKKQKEIMLQTNYMFIHRSTIPFNVQQVMDFHFLNWEALVKHILKVEDVTADKCKLLLAHDGVAKYVAQLLLFNKFKEEV